MARETEATNSFPLSPIHRFLVFPFPFSPLSPFRFSVSPVFHFLYFPISLYRFSAILDTSRVWSASYRKKWPAYQIFLTRGDGVDCAYGAGVLCPQGMGMVEDRFTLPDFCKRGIATAIIARAISHGRSQGAEQILIGALATKPIPSHRLHVDGTIRADWGHHLRWNNGRPRLCV